MRDSRLGVERGLHDLAMSPPFYITSTEEIPSPVRMNALRPEYEKRISLRTSRPVSELPTNQVLSMEMAFHHHQSA
jgi:hypothetical protein